jgi:predicted nuclease of predicted toxin-antitoxin system
VTVVFFFDGVTSELERDTWIRRRQMKVDKIVKMFENLDNNPSDLKKHVKGTLPSVVSATCSFVAKYECKCNVHVSVSDCDVEIADSAQKEDCFAILSQDTDFVILKGARHVLTVDKLNLETMTTFEYSQEGLLNFLGLELQELYLLASLLGNNIVPVSKLKNFHERLKQDQNGRELVRVVVDYVKKWNFSTSCDDERLREIAKDVFGDDSMASDLANSIQKYVSPSSGGQEGATVADTQVSDRKPVIILTFRNHASYIQDGHTATL